MSTTSPDRLGTPVAAGSRVEVDRLTWRPFGRREPVLADLSLTLEPGERMLLAGPSGSGKSTLLRALAGVLTTTESGDLTGSVLVDGAPPAGAAVGLLVQDPADASVAGRVGRDVAFGPENLGMPRPAIWARVADALRSVGFPHGVDRATSALSGGEAQRLALAGVLALRPGLVLLDEPTSMLDPSSAAVVRAAVLDAVVDAGATLVLVEHQVEPWLDLVDRVVVLDGSGTRCADGPVRATLAAETTSLLARGVWVPGEGAPSPLPVDPGLCAPVGAAPAVEDALVEASSVTVTRAPRAGLGVPEQPGGPVLALAEVTAGVRPGEVVAVTGPSGAGKTTLTGLLAGLEAPTTGSVVAGASLRAARPAPGAAPTRVAGAAAVAPEPATWGSAELAARVGWVPQQAELAVVGRTVRDDVLATARRLGQDEAMAAARADGLLDTLGLAHVAGADPHHLSGGEMRRLALAGALAHGPAVLVLDEPTVGQDRLTWAAVAGVVLAARDAGLGVVVATHDPHLVAVADREVRLTPAAAPAPTPATSSAATPATTPATSSAATPDATPAAARTREAARGAGRWGGLAARSGPLSVLLASALLLAGAPFIRDLRTALVALAAELALAPFVLGRTHTPLRSLAPGLLAVVSVGFSNWLLSVDHSWASGATAGLRVAFFVLPGVALAARIDPSALGDHLAQRVHLPARPVIAAVAALQRFDALGSTWDQLARTHRVRGLAPGRSPVARARHLSALTFALLVQTLRQAGRMAVAMEARGFSRGGDRTWAEAAPWTAADTAMTALGLAVAGIPALVSLLG
ncbi:MAG: ATP-binding cassette domain-containing protein [Oryzihumus sp.]